MRSDGILVTMDLDVAALQCSSSAAAAAPQNGPAYRRDAPGWRLAAVLEKVSVHPRKFEPRSRSWRLRMGSRSMCWRRWRWSSAPTGGGSGVSASSKAPPGRRGRYRLAPSRRAAAHGLKKNASAKTGLGRRKHGQSRAQLAFPVLAERRFIRARLEEDGFGAAGRESDFGIRPGVADHHLIEQAAQFLRDLRLPGPLPVDKSLAKFLWGRKALLFSLMMNIRRIFGCGEASLEHFSAAKFASVAGTAG